MSSLPSPFLTISPAGRGITVGYGNLAQGVFRFDTDAIGTLSLTLTNLVIGSAIEIQTQAAGTSLYNGTASGTTATLTLSAYGIGSANNNLRIKVRKGSTSPYYQPYETLTTAFVGSQSIYIAQVADE